MLPNKSLFSQTFEKVTLKIKISEQRKKMLSSGFSVGGHTRSQIQFNHFFSTAVISHLGVTARSLCKIVTKDDKKAEVLNAFPSSVFNSKTSFLGSKPSELEDRNVEQYEDPSPRENGQQADT